MWIPIFQQMTMCFCSAKKKLKKYFKDSKKRIGNVTEYAEKGERITRTGSKAYFVSDGHAIWWLRDGPASMDYTKYAVNTEGEIGDALRTDQYKGIRPCIEVNIDTMVQIFSDFNY